LQTALGVKAQLADQPICHAADVTDKDKTTRRAGKVMGHRELLTTAIAVRRKIRRLGITEIEGLTELLCREFGATVKRSMLINHAPVA